MITMQQWTSWPTTITVGVLAHLGEVFGPREQPKPGWGEMWLSAIARAASTHRRHLVENGVLTRLDEDARPGTRAEVLDDTARELAAYGAPQAVAVGWHVWADLELWAVAQRESLPADPAEVMRVVALRLLEDLVPEAVPTADELAAAFLDDED